MGIEEVAERIINSLDKFAGFVFGDVFGIENFIEAAFEFLIDFIFAGRVQFVHVAADEFKIAVGFVIQEAFEVA